MSASGRCPSEGVLVSSCGAPPHWSPSCSRFSSESRRPSNPYTKKDGTYVSGHYRSEPGESKSKSSSSNPLDGVESLLRTLKA